MEPVPDNFLQLQIDRLSGQVDVINQAIGDIRTELRRRNDRDRVRFRDDGKLGRAEAAKFLGLAPATLNGMAKRRQGPPFKVYRGKAEYRLADLEAWSAAERRDGSHSKPLPDRALPLFMEP